MSKAKVTYEIIRFLEDEAARIFIRSDDIRRRFPENTPSRKVYEDAVEKINAYQPKGYNFLFDLLKGEGYIMENPKEIEHNGKKIVCGPKTPRTFWNLPTELHIGDQKILNEIIDLVVEADTFEEAHAEYNRLKQLGDAKREEGLKLIYGPVFEALKTVLQEGESVYLRGTYADKRRIVKPEDDIDLIIVSEQDSRKLRNKVMVLFKEKTDRHFDVNVFNEQACLDTIKHDKSEHHTHRYLFDNSKLIYGPDISHLLKSADNGHA
jgi:hypothetical protein